MFVFTLSDWFLHLLSYSNSRQKQVIILPFLVVIHTIVSTTFESFTVLTVLFYRQNYFSDSYIGWIVNPASCVCVCECVLLSALCRPTDPGRAESVHAGANVSFCWGTGRQADRQSVCVLQIQSSCMDKMIRQIKP